MSSGRARVAIVTGGARGIGEAIARHLAGEGTAAVIADLDAAPAAAVERGIREAGGEAMAVRVDVGDPGAVRGLMEAVAERYGRLDVLVNNAAIYPVRPVEAVTVEEWEGVLRVNLTGPFLCAQAALPLMRRTGGGRIVHIISNTIWSAPPGLTAYIASKAGLLGLTRALAREAGPWGITVNAIAPGLTRTATAAATYPDAVFADRAARRCLSREQVPDDVLGAVSFLASPEAHFITGQTLVVDGGLVFP